MPTPALPTALKPGRAAHKVASALLTVLLRDGKAWTLQIRNADLAQASDTSPKSVRNAYPLLEQHGIIRTEGDHVAPGPHWHCIDIDPKVARKASTLPVLEVSVTDHNEDLVNELLDGLIEPPKPKKERKVAPFQAAAARWLAFREQHGYRTTPTFRRTTFNMAKNACAGDDITAAEVEDFFDFMEKENPAKLLSAKQFGWLNDDLRRFVVEQRNAKEETAKREAQAQQARTERQKAEAADRDKLVAYYFASSYEDALVRREAFNRLRVPSAYREAMLASLEHAEDEGDYLSYLAAQAQTLAGDKLWLEACEHLGIEYKSPNANLSREDFMAMVARARAKGAAN